MSRKLLIYPLDRETAPLIRYDNQDYDEIIGITPKGRFRNLKELSGIDGGNSTGIELSEDFESAIIKCDSIAFLKGEGTFNSKEYSKYIHLAHSCGKHVILSKQILDLFRQLNQDIPYAELLEYEDFSMDKYLATDNVSLKNINVPIVTVLGMGNFTNKFELQLEIRKVFVKEGYKVLQLGSKEYSSLLGFQSLPKFLYNKSYGFSEKTYAFNQYLFERVKKEKPDIIIIGVPGGVVPLDSYYCNYFGELAHILATAAQPDIAILSTYYFPEFNKEFLVDLREHIHHKYNCEIDYFNIANTSYSIDTSNSSPEIAYLTQNCSLISSAIQKNIVTKEINVFNVFESNISTITSEILHKLVNNLDII